MLHGGGGIGIIFAHLHKKLRRPNWTIERCAAAPASLPSPINAVIFVLLERKLQIVTNTYKRTQTAFFLLPSVAE